MAWEPESITVSAEHIAKAITNVLVREEALVGFYVLTGEPPEIEMSRLMVSPEALGTGCGRLLWEHAVQTARDLEASFIRLDADPNSEPFYSKMGAITIGEHEWEPPMMPGWRVKKMRFEIQ